MLKNMDKQDVRIGTLVGCGMDSAAYIKQILSHGFESFQLTFWQTTEGVDWGKLADEVNAVLDGSGAVISSLGVFGNPLETEEKDLQTLKGFEDCIDHAHLFDCDIVAGFSGRLRGLRVDESMSRFAEIWQPLADRAGEKSVRIAFENCDMGGTWQSGDWNIAHNPTAWELMFEAVRNDNVGLEWEPCHQMVSLIDPIGQLKEWAPRVFHVHGKDASVHWDVVRKYGVHSFVPEDVVLKGERWSIPPFAHHRTPGFGDSNWTDIITILRRAGFKGSIDIEGWHDPIYKGDLEMTGQVRALRYLKECRGGDFVENPIV